AGSGGRFRSEGAPWEAPQQYIDNSPFYQLDKVNTPLIIQAGASDQAIIQHSDQVWVGMNKLKKDVIYLRYGGESHVLAGAANLQDYWQRVLEFLDAKLAPAAKAR
ncbi:MAG: S9 family peptidase, partial [Alphaproteobacteria bacterium]